MGSSGGWALAGIALAGRGPGLNTREEPPDLQNDRALLSDPATMRFT